MPETKLDTPLSSPSMSQLSTEPLLINAPDIHMRTALVAERQGIILRKAGEIAGAAQTITSEVTLFFGGRNVIKFTDAQVLQGLEEQGKLDTDAWWDRLNEGTNLADARDPMDVIMLAAPQHTLLTIGAIGGTPELRNAAVDLMVHHIETETIF